MALTRAQEVLQAQFGRVKRIVQGNITVLPDRAATWRRYDEINRGRHNRWADRAWRDGDAQQYLPGLDGFADRDANMVYVNGQTTLTSATAHEMLHMNTAADFRGAVGETLNEGTTEHLALKALHAAGVPMSTGAAYPDEVAFVRRLIEVVGEPVLMRAYFGGARSLISTFEAIQGENTWRTLKRHADALNPTAANTLLTPPSNRQKATAIRAILIDSWWVSDDDIAAVEGIFHSPGADRAALGAVVRAGIRELSSVGQRTRLRVMLSNAGIEWR